MPPTDPQQSAGWDRRRESGSSGWSNASSVPASINQRPKVPQDTYSNLPVASPTPGMIHRNPFQNPSPSPSVYGDSPLHPPTPRYASLRPDSALSQNSRDSSKQDLANSVNLSVGYLPSKFSRPLSPGISYRKANKGGGIPKQGGGTGAFANDASRMPGAGDEDYDGVGPAGRGGRLRWNRFKWILFTTNTALTLYSLGSLIATLLVWFVVWKDADILLVGNHGELTASTVAASVCIFTSLVGWAGILLNNRAFLAVYTVLLWISFALLVIPGYMTYKHATFNLEGKVNLQWSRFLDVQNRLVVQNILNCCGYYSPYVEATVSAKCYSRAQLPGCKGPYLDFEKDILVKWYTVVFSLVPLHLACIIAALLCSNHITYRFGKGMMPKAYRLNPQAMAAIMETYASQLAEQYNEEVNGSHVHLIESYAGHGGAGSRESSTSDVDPPAVQERNTYPEREMPSAQSTAVRDRGRRM